MIKLPTIKKFLCCFELETGGIFLGFFLIFVTAIDAAMTAVSFVLQIQGLMDSDQFVLIEQLGFIIACVLYEGFLLVWLIASIQLIRGVRTQNPKQLNLFLILSVLSIFLGFLYIPIHGIYGFIPAILNVFFSFYIFICVYSLREKFIE